MAAPLGNGYDQSYMAERSVILGLNAFHGDAAAALLVEGEVVAAIAEERLNRIKHSAGFPTAAVAEVMAVANLEPEALTAIAVGRNPGMHRLRKLAFVARRAPSIRSAILPRLRSRRALGNCAALAAAALGRPEGAFEALPLIAVEHHLAHAAGAFFGSPFDRAAIVTADGFGDFVSTAWGRGEHNAITLDGRLFYPNSLGIVYQAVTQFIGFPHYGDEGKTMGLAPYGTPRFLEQLKRLAGLRGDGHVRLGSRYFRHVRHGVATDWSGTSPEVEALYTSAWTRLFGPPRAVGEPLSDRDRDLAASVQALVELALTTIVSRQRRQSGLDCLALAGGVALNCVFNGKIGRTTGFRENYIFPAAGDDGLAIGAAYWAYARQTGRRPRPLSVPLLGPSYPEPDIARLLAALPDDHAIDHRELDETTLYATAADRLAAGGIVGWFRGAVEFGPRALGARSIVADPRDPEMKARLNARIKHREPFRPFAPAVLADHASDWFCDAQPSPAMLHALPIRGDRRERLPAVTHVDGTGRIQTVSAADHPAFAKLIAAFAERSGVPILLNTSFNENEPIVRTPEEALACFLRTDMDALAIENHWFERRRDKTRSATP